MSIFGHGRAEYGADVALMKCRTGILSPRGENVGGARGRA